MKDMKILPKFRLSKLEEKEKGTSLGKLEIALNLNFMEAASRISMPPA